MNKLIVFSGGPYSGKTTTINEFKKSGHTVIKEAALDVIEELRLQLGHDEQQRFISEHPVEFQKKIFEKQIENEKRALFENHKDNLIFLDRSVIDGFGYLHFNKKHWEKDYFDFIPNYNYHQIFIFDTLGNFENRKESGRVENSIEDSLAIKNSILFTYQFFGYKPFIIFEKSLNKRIEDIKTKFDFL